MYRSLVSTELHEKALKKQINKLIYIVLGVAH